MVEQLEGVGLHPFVGFTQIEAHVGDAGPGSGVRFARGEEDAGVQGHEFIAAGQQGLLGPLVFERVELALAGGVVHRAHGTRGRVGPGAGIQNGLLP